MAGLYIHIPFCASRCVYCDFFSSTDFSFKRGYIDAVCRELELRIHELRDEPVFTVYLGGGTPSSLSPSERGRLFRTLSTVVDWSICKEVTLEVNPDDVTPLFISQLKDTPVNRLSMGIQSFDDSDLVFLRRRHTAHAAMEAVDNCLCAGYENISIDLIYGLPGQTVERWTNNLRQAVTLNVPHISAYNLIYENSKIGYIVSFKLKSGEEINTTIKNPDDVFVYRNYLENYLYDDINQVQGEWYSHLLQSEVTDKTRMTSIKFTAGQDIDKVGDTIKLTAFVYNSDDDFDASGNYKGNVSYTVTIKNTAQ